jgi:alkaline phosphatase D
MNITLFIYFCLYIFCIVLLPLNASSNNNDNIINPNNHHFNTNISTIGFGACNRHYKSQPLWPSILNDKPQMWIWLGDIIYADNSFLEFIRWPGDPQRIKSMFDVQSNREDYKLVKKSIPYILGTWDDHDMGENDANTNYIYKHESKQLFLDFLDEPKDSIRRNRDGVYSAYSYGSKGQRLKVIMLDTRFNQNFTSEDLLGENQWQWLKKQLTFKNNELKDDTIEYTDNHEPDLIIISSSIQVVPRQRPIGEGWHNFPKSRMRLFRLITEANLKSAVIIISGDVHYSELTQTDICVNQTNNNDNNNIIAQRFIDVTSSGMTHSMGDVGYILSPLMNIGLHLLVDGQQKREDYTEVFIGLNYGLINIDWQNKVLNIDIKTTDNRVGLSYKLPFNELTPQIINQAQFNTLSTQQQQRIRICQDEDAKANVAPFNIGGVPFVLTLLTLFIVFSLGLLGAITFAIQKGRNPPNTKQKKQ